MVNVGVVGLGLDWELRFRPALRMLRDRIAVRAFHDPVASRTQQVATEWNAAAVDGLAAIAKRTDVRALLLLDAGWGGWHTVQLLSTVGKPLLIVDGIDGDAASLLQLHERAMLQGQTLMPAFGLRYTPASSRLRELIATRLGPVKSLTLDAAHQTAGNSDSQFYACVDWCRYVIGTSPLRVEAGRFKGEERVESSDRNPQTLQGLGAPVGRPQPPLLQRSNALAVQIDFASANSSDDVVPAMLRLAGVPAAPKEEDGGSSLLATDPIRATVVCQNGTATVESETRIVWQAGGDLVSESLTSERTEIEVMLDLFCRRVVGGLIPVADISDVLRGVQVQQAVQRSRRDGCSVPVESNP